MKRNLVAVDKEVLDKLFVYISYNANDGAKRFGKACTMSDELDPRPLDDLIEAVKELNNHLMNFEGCTEATNSKVKIIQQALTALGWRWSDGSKFSR